jgi:type VI secretion system secreted protein Hcp
MAVNFLLKLDGGGIKGESPVDGFKDYMEIISYHFGAKQTGTFAYGQGGGGGKVSMDDFEFNMKTNQASPKLMEACANGTAIKTATLVCRKAGGKTAVEFLKVVMTDCLISSYHTGLPVSDGASFLPTRSSAGSDSVHDDDIPVCHIKLNFSKIVFTYKDQKADGSAGSAIEGGWDQKKMKSGK